MADRLSEDLASLRIPNRIGRNPDAGKGWRTAVLALGVLAALAGGVVWFGGSLRDQLVKTEVEVTEVRTVSPAVASLKFTATGFLIAQSASKVGAKLEGRVAAVRVREGSRVAIGDVLVELDAAPWQAGVATAKARLRAAAARADVARATHAETRRQHEREQGLLARGAAAPATVEDLAGRVTSLAEGVRAAEADIAAAQTEVESREIDLAYIVIRAPIAGVVVGKPVEAGEMVGPSSGPVAELADMTSLVVEADVPEGRLHQVQIGSPVEVVVDAYPARRHRGAVAEISPRVNRAKATVIVKVRFVDPVEGLLPDMAARVSLLDAPMDVATLHEAPKRVVPSAAVLQRDGVAVVFLVDDGRARLTRVTLGAAMAGGFELLDGPRDGSRLVAHPPATLTDGAAIREKNR